VTKESIIEDTLKEIQDTIGSLRLDIVDIRQTIDRLEVVLNDIIELLEKKY